MYHPEIIDRRLYRVQQNLPFKLKEYDVGDSIDRQEHLEKLISKEGTLIRELRPEEKQFILNEILVSTYNFKYWSERYAKAILEDGGELVRTGFWPTQEIAHKHIQKGEYEAWKYKKPNFWVWCKARQLGATQYSLSVVCHKGIFYEHQRTVIASDEPGHTLSLLRRYHVIYDGLPWWMKPEASNRVKTFEGEALYLPKLNSRLVTGHGRKKGGGIAQGDSTNAFHLTEIPDWENHSQIEEDFLPTAHNYPTNIGFMESTGRGRNDHWHLLFKRAWSGKHPKLRALFIPYYAEGGKKYSMPYPENWRPNKVTIAHAEKVKNQSPLYCHGETVELTKEQMYWWELNYIDAKDAGKLPVFLQEYASDHEESFQAMTVSMFPHNMIQELRSKINPGRIVVFQPTTEA